MARLNPPPADRPWIRRNRGSVGAGAAVALLFVAVAAVAASGDRTAAAGPAASAVPTPAAVVPVPSAFTYSGQGDEIVAIGKPTPGPVLVTIRASGSAGALVVRAHAADGSANELLVDAVGEYSGTQVLDPDPGDDTGEIEVRHAGAWQVTLAPLTEARRTNSAAVSGRGPDVFRYGGPTTAVVITHQGESNFVVDLSGRAGSELIVNEIGSYAGGRILTGGSLVQIDADGDWSIDPA